MYKSIIEKTSDAEKTSYRVRDVAKVFRKITDWLLQPERSILLQQQGVMRKASGSSNEVRKMFIDAILKNATVEEAKFTLDDSGILGDGVKDFVLSGTNLYAVLSYALKNLEGGVLIKNEGKKRLEMIIDPSVNDETHAARYLSLISELVQTKNLDDLYAAEIIYTLHRLGKAVVQYAKRNLMSSTNVAVVLKPNMLETVFGCSPTHDTSLYLSALPKLECIIATVLDPESEEKLKTEFKELYPDYKCEPFDKPFEKVYAQEKLAFLAKAVKTKNTLTRESCETLTKISEAIGTTKEFLKVDKKGQIFSRKEKGEQKRARKQAKKCLSGLNKDKTVQKELVREQFEDEATETKSLNRMKEDKRQKDSVSAEAVVTINFHEKTRNKSVEKETGEKDKDKESLNYPKFS